MDTNMKMPPKSFPTLTKILILFLTIVSCKHKADESLVDNDSKLFVEEVNKDMAVFKEYDSIHYLESSYFLNASQLCKEADSLVELIQLGGLSKKNITDFKQHLNTYCKTSNYTVEYEDLEKMDNHFKIFKIRTYQTLAINSLSNTYKSFYYPMESLKPVVAPRKNILKVGEKFIADIYLAGNNATNKYIVVIDKDTLKYTEDNNFPIYETNPTMSKGEKEINGIMKIYHPNLHRAINLPFSYKYVVQ